LLRAQACKRKRIDEPSKRVHRKTLNRGKAKRRTRLAPPRNGENPDRVRGDAPLADQNRGVKEVSEKPGCLWPAVSGQMREGLRVR